MDIVVFLTVCKRTYQDVLYIDLHYNMLSTVVPNKMHPFSFSVTNSRA